MKTMIASSEEKWKPYFLVSAQGRSTVITTHGGDLVVMGGRCQQDWVHGVPKTPGTREARISVNFQSSAQARRRAS